MKKILYVMGIMIALFVISFSATANADESTREVLLNTLDSLQEIVDANPLLPPSIQVRIDKERENVIWATADELNNISEDYKDRLILLERKTKQLAALFASKQSAKVQHVEMTNELVNSSQEGNDEPYVPQYNSQALYVEYPSYSWSFEWDDVEEPEGDPQENYTEGICGEGGYSFTTRSNILTIAIVAEAIKDIAEQICGQNVTVVIGGNISLACIVTDVAAYIAIGINEHQELCNDFMTAAEVTATWEGVNAVHGNVQMVYEKLSELQSNQEIIMRDLQAIIELLNTPSGQRTQWPVK